MDRGNGITGAGSKDVFIGKGSHGFRILDYSSFE